MAATLGVQYERGNAYLGIGLSLASGACTLLGAVTIYSTRFVRLRSPIQLARALSFATGVMLFISLVELLPHSVENFQLAIKQSASSVGEKNIHGFGWVLATLAYSVGISLMFLIDAVANHLIPFQKTDEILQQQQRHRQSQLQPHPIQEEAPTLRLPFDSHPTERTILDEPTSRLEENYPPSHDCCPPPVLGSDLGIGRFERREILRAGIICAIAFAIQSIPEGIAIYASTSETAKIDSVPIAIASALQNIAQGISVSGLIFAATESHKCAFTWCICSAIAEPFGSLFGWLLFEKMLHPILYGVLYGIVSGLIVSVCIKEVLPIAYECAGDQKQRIASATFSGIVLMGSTFVLFAYLGVVG